MHYGLMTTFSSITTPSELALELGHSDGKRIRRYLRKIHPAHFKNQRWGLSHEHAADVLAHFSRGAA